MDSNQLAFEAQRGRSYSMSFMEDLSALQLHPKPTDPSAASLPSGSSEAPTEPHFCTPALPQHFTNGVVESSSGPQQRSGIVEPPEATTPDFALPHQPPQHSPQQQQQQQHLSPHLQVLHLPPTTEGMAGGIVGDGLRAEAPSRRPGGGRALNGAFVGGQQQQQQQTGGSSYVQSPLPLNGYVPNNLPTCLQQTTIEELPSGSSSPSSSGGSGSGFVVSPLSDDADPSGYLSSPPPTFDQMLLARRNSMPAMGSRRPSYPLQHAYTPLTEVPTLGRALAEGNLHQRKSIQSFLTTLAQHSLERTEKRRRERAHRDHSHKKARRGRGRDTLYSSSDSEGEDGANGMGETEAKSERSAPLLSPTLLPSDSPQQSSFVGFDYASEAMTGFISSAVIGGEQQQRLHQEAEGTATATATNISDYLLPEQHNAGQPAFHLGQPPLKYTHMSRQAQNLHLHHHHQLHAQQLQLERKIQQRFPQRHSYPPSHSAQYSYCYPPEEGPMLVPIMHPPAAAAAVPAQPHSPAILSPLFNTSLPHFSHQPLPENQPLQHSPAQEVVELQHIREAAAYKDFFDEFSGYEMTAAQPEVPEEPIKVIPSEIVLSSGQVGTSIEDEISVLAASELHWIESNDTLTEDAKADDIFNQIFNLDDAYVAASM